MFTPVDLSNRPYYRAGAVALIVSLLFLWAASDPNPVCVEPMIKAPIQDIMKCDRSQHKKP